MPASILLVDDEPTIRLSVGDALRDAGYDVTESPDGQEAMSLIRSQVFDVVITDIRLPRVDGLTLFRSLRVESPSTCVILITAFGSVSDAVSALREGAADYLTKPFDTEEILLRISRHVEQQELKRELAMARAALGGRAGESEIIGQSPPMIRLFDRIQAFAESDAAVLVFGESGTGKELVAKSLHRQSPRSNQPFVAVNCASFPETLLEAELFGYERGAFTGATRRREGRFKSASEGTLFLDEVAEIPLSAQAKLLRVLEEKVIEPLGTNRSIAVDVRILAATHRNLRERIAEGFFREDLYYRLNVLEVTIPPLRERRGDLTLLVEFFLNQLAAGESPPVISARAYRALSEHNFPGNVRELQHAMHHAFVLSRGREIGVEHLPVDVAGDVTKEHQAVVKEQDDGFMPLGLASKMHEREYLIRALRLADGKRTRAAELLGISRKNLWEKCRNHGITNEELE